MRTGGADNCTNFAKVSVARTAIRFRLRLQQGGCPWGTETIFRNGPTIKSLRACIRFRHPPVPAATEVGSLGPETTVQAGNRAGSGSAGRGRLGPGQRDADRRPLGLGAGREGDHARRERGALAEAERTLRALWAWRVNGPAPPSLRGA
jgi:hypothetical protein